MSERKKERPIKIRKSWIRNPAEQVVQDKDVQHRENKRQIRDEALEDYEEENDTPTDHPAP